MNYNRIIILNKFFVNIKESPSFEDNIIQNIYSTLDHTVENASCCFVQSLSNYNSLNHALSLTVDVYSDPLSHSAINGDYMAEQNQMKEIEENAEYCKQIIGQMEEKTSLEEAQRNGFFSAKKVTETLKSQKSEFETVQLRHIQTKERTGERNGNTTTDDFCNKENDEHFDNDEYTKVAVRDLISTFEKQTRPVIRYKLREDKLPEPAKMTIGLSTDEMKQSVTVSSCQENKSTVNQCDQLEQSNGYLYRENETEFLDQFESSKNDFMNGNYENKNVVSDNQPGKRFSCFSFLVNTVLNPCFTLKIRYIYWHSKVSHKLMLSVFVIMRENYLHAAFF